MPHQVDPRSLNEMQKPLNSVYWHFIVIVKMRNELALSQLQSAVHRGRPGNHPSEHWIFRVLAPLREIDEHNTMIIDVTHLLSGVVRATVANDDDLQLFVSLVAY